MLQISVQKYMQGWLVKREVHCINLEIFIVLDVNMKVLIVNIITSIRLMIAYR